VTTRGATSRLGGALSILVFAGACGRGGGDRFGTRKPADDHLCPPQTPRAYLPDDIDRAKAAGCAVVWRMMAGPPGPDGGHPDAYEQSAFCCPDQ